MSADVSTAPLADNIADVNAAAPAGSRMKKIGKALLDNAPPLVTIGFSFTHDDQVIRVLCWCSVSLALLALVVDFIHCRHRWAAGLEAVFPKMITLTYFVMTSVVLVLLYGGVIEASTIVVLNGCFCTGGLCLASLISLIIGRPWILGLAVEFMPPEKMQEIRSTPQGRQVFEATMTGLTQLWTAVFLLMFLVALACTFWKFNGGGTAANFASMPAMALIVFVCTRCVQPRVIEMSKERAMRHVVGGTSADDQA